MLFPVQLTNISSFLHSDSNKPARIPLKFSWNLIWEPRYMLISRSKVLDFNLMVILRSQVSYRNSLITPRAVPTFPWTFPAIRSTHTQRPLRITLSIGSWGVETSTNRTTHAQLRVNTGAGQVFILFYSFLQCSCD